jgi:hypothetical protein
MDPQKKRVSQSNKKLLALYLGEKSTFDKEDLNPKKVNYQISAPKPSYVPKTWQRTINMPKIVAKND